MLNSLLNELKQIAKMRHIKGYNSMSNERLLVLLMNQMNYQVM